MHVDINVKRTETICSRIKASWHTISRMYNTYANEDEFTISMAYVLLNLSVARGVPSTHIGPMLGMESRSLTRVLKKMEEMKIISKEVGKEDRRQVMIFLTEEGKSYKQRAKVIVRDFNSKLIKQIPDDKLETFIEVLNQINRISETNHLTNLKE